jgi:formamidopyrimidine-DNA glycosylase
MPEGPEVATMTDKIRERITSLQILNITKKLDYKKSSGLELLTFPQTVLQVKSIGKKMIIELADLQIVFSFGMTGRFTYTEEKHSHVTIQVENDKDFYFTDVRKIGNVKVLPHDHEYINALGPCLLTASRNKEIEKDEWLRIFKRKKFSTRAIHDVLLDQTYVSGIGFYLMTEILYFAKVHPERKANTLSEDEWEQIRIYSHELIHKSYSYGGLTIETYFDPDGKPGLFPVVCYRKQEDLLGNKVTDKPLLTKGGKSKGRTLHFVEAVQK